MTRPENYFCCVVLFVLMAAWQGLCDDIILTCPAKWYDGQTVTLSCSVNALQWKSPSPCSISYSDSVAFTFTPNGERNEKTERSIANVKSNCTSAPNADGCWCNQTGNEYYLFCNVTADEAKYSQGAWRCQPDCAGSGTVMKPQQSRECEYTTFSDACECNPCSPGKCTVVNHQPKCSCEGTSYTGDTCKELKPGEEKKLNCRHTTTANPTSQPPCDVCDSDSMHISTLSGLMGAVVGAVITAFGAAALFKHCKTAALQQRNIALPAVQPAYVSKSKIVQPMDYKQHGQYYDDPEMSNADASSMYSSSSTLPE